MQDNNGDGSAPEGSRNESPRPGGPAGQAQPAEGAALEHGSGGGSRLPRWTFLFQYFIPRRSGVMQSMMTPPSGPAGNGRESLGGAAPAPNPPAPQAQPAPAADPRPPAQASATASGPDLPAAAPPPAPRSRPPHPHVVVSQPSPAPDSPPPLEPIASIPARVPGTHLPGTAAPPPSAASPAPPTPTYFLPNAINMSLTPSGYPIFWHPAVGPFVVTGHAGAPEEGHGDAAGGPAQAAEGQPDPAAAPQAAGAQAGEQGAVHYHLTPLTNLPPAVLAQLFPPGTAFLHPAFFFGPGGGPQGTWESDRGRPPTASNDAIRRLPVMRYVTRKLWERNRSCTVCFEDLPQGAVPPPPASDSEYDKVVVRMPCSHLFHLPCLAPWLRNQSNACPACRYELPTGDPAFDAGVGERMALWKVDPEPEGNAVEVRAEMMGLPSEEEEEEPAEEPESDGCEMRRVVGRCLRAPQGTPALAAELAAAEGIPVPAGAEIRGTDAIDAWNRSLREMAGCGHRFHAECLAGLLSVRGYAMPTSGEEVRCPVCRKVGTVRAVGEQVDGMEVEQDETRKRKAGEDWVGGAEELLRVVRSMARDDGSHVVIADLD